MTAKPYDPTLKALVETEPESWPALLGDPVGPTEVIDADIATVSGAADKVLRVNTPTPYLLHLEFISGHDATTLPRKLCVRNGLLGGSSRIAGTQWRPCAASTGRLAEADRRLRA